MESGGNNQAEGYSGRSDRQLCTGQRATRLCLCGCSEQRRVSFINDDQIGAEEQAQF